MATRTLLSKAFQGRRLFCKAQNALYGNGPAQCWETVHFQRFCPWFLQRLGVVIPSHSNDRQTVIHGDRWREELKNLNKAARDHLRLDLVCPQEAKISAEEGKRLLRLTQKDILMKRLREIPYACISLKELLRICLESTGQEDVEEVLKSLDESGRILIVGDRVYIRTEEVARVMENILCLLNTRREELEEMEKQKAKIDVEAEKIVRREMWGGLGFMSFQTAYLMWLTFWELSWDVMEPICFFLTSTYFLAGYAFFLTTSTDPTFEGFFHARFKTTQKRLMKKSNFEIDRFKELCIIAGPSLRQPACGGLCHSI